MKYTYRPKGVCSQMMELDIDGDKVTGLKVVGGCSGNLQGIAKLVEGGFKSTSCPDQIAKALEQYKSEL